MAEKWEDKLIELEAAVIEYVRTIPRADRHTVIRRIFDRAERLRVVVDDLDDIA
jgi:hypothetical protein